MPRFDNLSYALMQQTHGKPLPELLRLLLTLKIKHLAAANPSNNGLKQKPAVRNRIDDPFPLDERERLHQTIFSGSNLRNLQGHFKNT
jgi:hypothetical protein